MAQNKKQIRIQQKVDQAANWETNNPVLMDKEIGYEKDTHSFKMGDGTTAWNSLDDFSSLYKGDHSSIYQTKSIMKSMMIKGFKITMISPNQSTIWLDTKGKSLETYMKQNDRITIKQGNKTYTATIMFIYTDYLNISISTNDTIYANQSYVLSDKGYYYEDWDMTSENINASFNVAQATGKRSFAANSSKSTGIESFAEGWGSTANGTGSHAEGYQSIAKGVSSHAEGSTTTASGHSSHAEGNNTVANGDYQHVEGKFNIDDNDNKYVHIVGNGSYESGKSNAHTLDWNGNAWFAGNVTVGGTYNSETGVVDGAKKLVDEEVIERIKYYGHPDIIPSDESYFTVNETGETITGLTDSGKTQTELVIPYKINGKEITTLFSGVDVGEPRSILNGNSVITKVIIPKSVTRLPRGVFYNCSSLTSINIPNSVIDIDYYAFGNCSALTSIYIPNSVKVIGITAFINCTSLTSINIPNSIISIAHNAFDGCSSLIALYCEQGSYAETYAKGRNIPVVYTDVKDIATETELERLQYYGDKDIIPSDEGYFTVNETGETITGLTDTGKTQTELVIPYKINGKKITSIGNGAFDSCTSLISINIPNSIIAIRISAFYGCSSLTSINIPNSVTSIGNDTFNGCSSLTSITIPNSITIIYSGTFQNCTGLTSVNIPNSVTNIDDYVFANCTGLTSITIPNSVTIIDSYAFENCTNLTIYCEQGSYAETYANTNNIPAVYTDISATDINKLNKTTKFSIDGGATAAAVSYNGTQDNVQLNVSKLQDNYIQFAESGSIMQNLSYTSQLALDQFSANRMLGFKPEQLLFEYSNDGGITWKTVEISDEKKMNFIYGNQIANSLIALGASSCNGQTTNTTDPAKDMSRITLSPGTDLYAIIKKIQIQTVFNNTLASGLKVEIQKRISDSWTSVCSSFLQGNSGWNDIFLNCTFGANSSTLNANWNAKEIRFVFSFSGLTSTNTTNLKYRPMISSISMFAPYLYDCTNSLFHTGKPYKINNSRQVEFETDIVLDSTKGQFKGNLDGIANYANIATKAEKDLDGNIISDTYLKKANFKNVASNSFILRTDPDLYNEGHRDAQTAKRIAYIPELKDHDVRLVIVCEYGTNCSYLELVSRNAFGSITTNVASNRVNIGHDELGNVWAYSDTADSLSYGEYVCFLVRRDVAQIDSLSANYRNMTLSPITSDQIDQSTCVFQLINYSGNDSNTKPTFNCSNTYTYTFNSRLKGQYLFVLNTYVSDSRYIPTVTVSQNGTNNTSTEVLSHGKYVKIYCPITVSKDYDSVTITITGTCRGENLSRSQYGADPYLFANLSYDKINDVQASWNELIYSSAGDNTMIFKYGTSGDLTIRNALDLSKSTYRLYEN